jgi:hypothetical protein
MRALEPHEVTDPPPRQGIDALVRDADGTTLAVLGVGPGTRYRIFDREWEPLTPVLEVRARLLVRRGLDEGFLVETEERWSMFTPTVAVMSTDGSMALLPTGPPGDPLTPDSLTFRAMSGRIWAYEPDDAVIRRPTFPARPRPGSSWPGDPADSMCRAPYHLDTPDPTAWTSDGGATWHEVLLSDVLPRGLPPDSMLCEAREERIVLGLATDQIFEQVCVVAPSPDPPGARNVGCHPVPDGADPWRFVVLADGRAVLQGGDRGGLYVATDGTNSAWRSLPGPAPGGTWVRAFDNYLVAGTDSSFGGDQWFSRDAGRTWNQIGLGNRRSPGSEAR